MKTKLFVLTLIAALAGCTVNQPVPAEPKNDLVNTYREPSLLFEVKYPKDWVVTDFADYSMAGEDKCFSYEYKNFISEKYGADMTERCGEGVEFQIANKVVPFYGYMIDTIPKGFNSINVQVLPVSTYIDDRDAHEESAKLTKEEFININDKDDKITLRVYDSKNYEFDDMMYPHIKAFYEGSKYNYIFAIAPEEAAKPFNEKDSNYALLKSVLQTFKEIN